MVAGVEVEEVEAEPATASFTGVAPADESRAIVAAAFPAAVG